MAKVKILVTGLLITTSLAGCSNTGTLEKTPQSNSSSVQLQQNKDEPTSYALGELANHNNAKDCWMAIDGKVYDVTTYVGQHPGGVEILKGCGKDASNLFEAQRKHQGAQAQDMLPQLQVGLLK